MKLQLTPHEGAALLLLIRLGHNSYFGKIAEPEVWENLDHLPTEHLTRLMAKVEAAAVRSAGVRKTRAA